jgi:hypothetical protein
VVPYSFTKQLRSGAISRIQASRSRLAIAASAPNT